MVTEYVKFSSSIKNSLMRHTLLKGTFVAFLGSLVLIWGGVFVPLSMLKHWGIWIVIMGGGLIILGLLPYRKLCRLEMNPNEIVIDKNEQLYLKLQGKLIFSLPISKIENVVYLEKKSIYGIGINLVHNQDMKIVIYDKQFNLSNLQKKSLKQYGYDLFLPYFSQKVFLSIESHCISK